MRHETRQCQYVVAKCIAAVVLTASCHTALAQEQAPSNSDDVEEIVVYGDKSLRQLRVEYYDAQQNFFDSFNSLNSDDDLDIGCEFMTPIGQRRRYRVCSPKFAAKAESAGSAQYLLSMHLARAQDEAPDFNTASSGAFPHDYLARKKEALMWKEMEALLSEQPELQDALAKLIAARKTYEAAQRRD